MNIHIANDADMHPATLDAVQSDVHHLYHLLDVAVEKLLDMPFERDGKRDVALDQFAALLWIARDRAEFIGKYIDENYCVLRGWKKGEAK